MTRWHLDVGGDIPHDGSTHERRLLAKLHELFSDPTWGVRTSSFEGQHISGEIHGPTASLGGEAEVASDLAGDVEVRKEGSIIGDNPVEESHEAPEAEQHERSGQ